MILRVGLMAAVVRRGRHEQATEHGVVLDIAWGRQLGRRAGDGASFEVRVPEDEVGVLVAHVGQRGPPEDALVAVIEAYQDLGRLLPPNTQIADANSPVWFETVICAP